MNMTKKQSIDYLKDLWNEVYNEDSDGYIYAEAIDIAIESLSADRPNGEWVNEWKDIDGGRMYGACCSVCHTIGHSGYNYCPSCGARMENTK